MNQKQPQNHLAVDDIIGRNSGTGSDRQGTIKANGEWQPILTGLKSCHIFEVIAMAYGKKGEGKYATLHAIASNAYTGKNGRIHCTGNYYGWKWWRRIGLRWVGTPFNYSLEMKTFSDYGNSGEIEYSITKLTKDMVYTADKESNFIR